MRLNAYLARAGVASRRKADELIKAGRVRVNGETGELNTFVGETDTVEVDGHPVGKQRLAHLLLHKPPGTVTTARDPQSRPTVVALVPAEPRVVPVGRLDADTTGALLLTNDGRSPTGSRTLATRWTRSTRPRSRATPGASATPARGGNRARRRPHRAGARAPLAKGRVELTIHEGRTHQVKRMLEAVGHPVRRLHRSRYAGLDAPGTRPRRVARAHPRRARAAAEARRLLVERDRRQDHVDRDEREPLVHVRLAVAGDLPQRDHRHRQRSDVHRVEDEGQPVGRRTARAGRARGTGSTRSAQPSS